MMQQQIPMYAADGRSLGFRSVESARRLIANGYVEAVYGRKGHLKAIQAKQEDGASAITTRRSVASFSRDTSVLLLMITCPSD